MSNEEVLKENGGKKFDIVLINPPYDKNVHLKFLRKTLNIAKTIINISPVRWLQDPFAGNKRSTLKQFEDVAKHIKSIEPIERMDKEKFDMHSYSNLAIYKLIDEETDFDYNNYWEDISDKERVGIIKKVCFSNKTKFISDVNERNKRSGIRVMIGDIAGNRGSLPIYKDIVYTIDGKIGDKDWTECKNMGGYTKPKNSPLPNSIKFKTIEEAQNFYDSYKNLKFFNTLCEITVQQQHIQLDVLPFLDDYTHKITDNDMYKLFDLNEDEIKYCENHLTLDEKRKRK